ncbi:L,D-transpeptidase family protein [Nitrosomonas eutropha]|uniref:L,D-transpeptidase ErfK/SrfK n=2 Tax=Nitrosomonas eutropha TaxID=916 RepID=A0ABX5MA75_9PROT|nr:L,D-transpeptidase family protein [Nitrosomonas eutropha]ABI58734.1 ErfK/YbiS/YcfS/YnhG family protein [Nitrosomonas eutropha C91]PXV80696.1 L,D-transpeptidase ErfK/SrfK [Nitrosomonas eutropha]SEI40950.1 L,D-transpeptidase ErfK/SrfK [Nitrosomonas eutropha]
MKQQNIQTLRISLLLLFMMLSLMPCVYAGSWVRPPDDIDILGQIQTVTASRSETLLDVARRYDIGQDEMMLANPNVNRWLPEEGAKVILPLRFIIPQAERTGLVINLPEMRLYYFPKPIKGQKPEIITHPVSIGRMDWNTPLGKTTIVRKQKDPTWTPPQSLRKEAIEEGRPPLLDVVPAGPDNPLGKYALYLGLPGYLIHGTNKPLGVGMRVTHGCMRLYPEDIEELFNLIPTGTPVQIVNQPIKLGWQGDLLYIELHPPLEEENITPLDFEQEIHRTILEFFERTSKDTDGRMTRNIKIDQQALESAIQARDGIPTLISED